MSLECQQNIKYYPLSARTDLFSSVIRHFFKILLPQFESNDLKIDFCFISILINIFDCYPGNTLPLEECAWYLSDIDQFNPSKELTEDMNKLSSLPPVNYTNGQSLEDADKWLCTDSGTWIRQLETLMIKHRNLGQDWQFSNDQKKLIKQYYDANKLLVDCLNSGCIVSNEVREEIEDTLLLANAEIERRKREKQNVFGISEKRIDSSLANETDL